MKKAFLFCFADDVGTADTVKDIVARLPQVAAWRYEMQHAIFLVSEYTANELAHALSAQIPRKYFIITELSTDIDTSQGWVSKDTAYLIQNKALKPPEPKAIN